MVIEVSPNDLCHMRLAGFGHVGIDVGAPEIAGEQVGGADAHHRSRHQRTDRDRRETEADEPARKQRLEQRRHHIVVT